jgi:hypothetical protein
MARPDEQVMVLNDYGLHRRERTLKSGAVKSRYTIEIKADPVIIGVDPRPVTKATAESIAEHFRKSIEAISANPKPATIKAQAVAARANAAGKAWATRQYSGGRMGSTPPQQTGRMFNNSGRLAKSLVVGATRDGWVVNVAANRFDPRTASEAGILRMFEQLRAMVPGWGNAGQLMNVLSVRKALNDSLRAQVRKATELTRDLEIQRVKAVIGLVRGLAG